MSSPLLGTISPFAISIIFILAATAFGLSFAAFAMYLAHRRRELWHQTARLALEKGQPVPADPDGPLAGLAAPGVDVAALEDRMRRRRRNGHITGGLLNLAVGAGLFVALHQAAPQSARFAAVPLFIGVAFLLVGAAESLFARKPQRPDAR